MTDDNGAPLFTWPAEHPQLIGAKCHNCGEVVFPRRTQCPKCYTESMEEVLLSRKGKVFSSTISYLAPGAPFEGAVPYSIGHVVLPERVLIPCRFAEVGDKPIAIDTDVELSIEEWGKDREGNTILMHVFRRAQ
jgi:uncharacterized OB-fold protein